MPEQALAMDGIPLGLGLVVKINLIFHVHNYDQDLPLITWQYLFGTKSNDYSYKVQSTVTAQYD